MLLLMLGLGSLSAGLSDLALIFPVAVGLEAVKMAEKNVTGLTSMLGRFQVILWDEYAAEKQRSRVARVVPHFQSSVGSVAPPQRRTNAFYRPSISDAFAREEGTIDPLFADWCEELYSRASSSNVDEPGLARLAAQDAGIIQCSLLRFLGKRQKVRLPRTTAQQLNALARLRRYACASCACYEIYTQPLMR